MPNTKEVNFYDQPLFRSFRITDDQMQSEEFLRIYSAYRSIFDRHDNTLRIDRPLAVLIVKEYEALAAKAKVKPKPKAEARARAKENPPADPPKKPRGRPPKQNSDVPEGVAVVSSVK